MEKYKISIITVTKNSEKHLKKNIRSVLNQSYKNYEHIIVDGNSSDKTIKIIKSYKNKIKLIKNHNDKGLYHAMNVGIKNASGDIIGTFLLCASIKTFGDPSNFDVKTNKLLEVR